MGRAPSLSLATLNNILGKRWAINWPNGPGYYTNFLHVHKNQKSSLFLGNGIMIMVNLGYNETVVEENKWHEGALSWA
jgi:hypothetical protein